jgi:DNA-binding NarL/FixJ family response regulator
VAGIRTVLVTVSPLLAGIIEQAVSRHGTFDVVARFDSRDFAAQKLRETSPDLILVGLRPGEPDEVAHSLLILYPLAKVIALSTDGDRGYVHEMRPSRTVLVDLSLQALIKQLLTPTPVRKRYKSSRREA